MGMIEMEKKGTGYFFLHELSTSRDCAFSSRKRKKVACPLFIMR